MLDPGLFVVIVLFSLSLLGAIVLFKFMESRLHIEKKILKASGAVGGFIVIFGILFKAYMAIHDVEKTQKEMQDLRIAKEQETKNLEKTITDLRNSQAPKTIDGSIIPPSQFTKIILAVKQVDTDMNGHFRFHQKCVNMEEDDLGVFVITRDGKYYSLKILRPEDMMGIKINLPN